MGTTVALGADRFTTILTSLVEDAQRSSPAPSLPPSGRQRYFCSTRLKTKFAPPWLNANPLTLSPSVLNVIVASTSMSANVFLLIADVVNQPWPLTFPASFPSLTSTVSSPTCSFLYKPV